jgi:hypothetical protein
VAYAATGLDIRASASHCCAPPEIFARSEGYVAGVLYSEAYNMNGKLTAAVLLGVSLLPAPALAGG